MTKEETWPVVVLQTPDGKWMWTAAQAGLGFVPKGKRKPDPGWSIQLTPLRNTFDNAYTAALQAEIGRYAVAHPKRLASTKVATKATAPKRATSKSRLTR